MLFFNSQNARASTARVTPGRKGTGGVFRDPATPVTMARIVSYRTSDVVTVLAILTRIACGSRRI